MIKYSRTQNTIRNTTFGLLFMVLNYLGSFLSRTVLIYVLGIEYVGLEGLFSSILTMLNMAELGFSTAIVYKLYKPVADNDVDTVCALMKYYKKIYIWIGIIVATIGITLLPFLKFFIKDEIPPLLNIYILYGVYLLNTCLTYWLFAYKTAILNANQRNDYVSKVNCIICLLKNIIQIILLLTTRNYYIYIFVIPACTLLTNIGNAFMAHKYYPQYICKGDLKKEDKIEIKNKVKVLLYNKIGVSVINGSDNIVISSFLGIVTLGIYTSYYYIFNMLYNVFAIFHNAVTAGIGNKIIIDDVDENISVFKKMVFLNFWASSWSSICLLCLYRPFISLWIGNEKALTNGFSLLMAMYFYFWMIRFPVIIFKNAQGLWKEDCLRPFIEGITNLCLNILMVQVIGIYGIVLSTILAMLIISLPWETKVLFSKYFKKSTHGYYKEIFLYTMMCIITAAITFVLTMIFDHETIQSFVFKVAVCIIVPNLIYLIVFSKTKVFGEVRSIIKGIFNR